MTKEQQWFSKHAVKSRTSTVAAYVHFLANKHTEEKISWRNGFCTMMQLPERRKTKLTVCLTICLSHYLCRLTFHTEFGAPAVFVDENKKD